MKFHQNIVEKSNKDYDILYEWIVIDVKFTLHSSEKVLLIEPIYTYMFSIIYVLIRILCNIL